MSQSKDEKEKQRHIEMINKIKSAKTKEDVPNASISSVTRFLANNSVFKGVKLRQSVFNPVLSALLAYNFFQLPEVKAVYIKVLKDNYPDITEDEIEERFKAICKTPNIYHYIIEVSERAGKLKEFKDKEDLDSHKARMEQIREAFDVKDLPKVGIGTLNGKIMKATKNDFVPRFSIEQIREISQMLLNHKEPDDIEEKIYDICKSYGLSEDDTNLMYDQVEGGILLDKTILYTVEEIEAKEARILQIYRMDHEEIMDSIREATRICHMPPNLTDSILAAYLSGNTTIYPKAKMVSTTDLKELTALLLGGFDFSSPEVDENLQKIAEKYYPSNSQEAKELLKAKLESLPRTGYLIEEINASNAKQAELIGNHNSNVNVYFIPNPKSPMESGKFYNVYTNYGEVLDLNEVLPENFLNMDYGVPEGEDNIDAMEWWLQENIDSTFKLRGGVILYKDENIGGVNIFRPSGGPIGITPEQAAKNEKLAALGQEVQELIRAQEEGNAAFKEMQRQYQTYQNGLNEKLKVLKGQLEEINKDSNTVKQEPEAEEQAVTGEGPAIEE